MEEHLREFQTLVSKLKKLSYLKVKQFLGVNSNDNDPRVKYLANLDLSISLLSSHVAALLEPKDGSKPPKSVALEMLECVEKQVKLLQEELAVTGWDKDGNPLLDLANWADITKGWPR